MSKPLALGTVLGGVILFVWGAVYHSVLPFANQAFLAFGDEEAVTRAITTSAPRSGTYFLPYVPQSGSDAYKKAAEDRLSRGPFLFACVRLGPMGSLGSYLGAQLAINLLTAFFLTLLLLHVRVVSVSGRALFLVGVALAGWVARSLPSWNWYAFSDAYTLAELADLVVGFALAGLALARVVPRA
jgi:hypothetical protein